MFQAAIMFALWSGTLGKLILTGIFWMRAERQSDGINWIAFDELAAPIRMKAKTRYRQTEQWATAELLADGKLRLLFDEPQRAITVGQAVVFYDGDTVLGGGTIVEAIKI